MNRTTGNPRQINEADLTLHDLAAPDDAQTAVLCTRLARLRRLEQALHWAAAEAHDLGLSATWITVEGADDNVDAAIADVRRQLQGRR
jgi:hypothetical protein